MIRFEYTHILLLLFLIPVFTGLFIWMRCKRVRKINSFSDALLFHKLTPDTSPSRPITKFVLLMLGLTFLIIALANPQKGTKVIEGERNGIDVVICLDISNSMLAEDISPNRLSAAKLAISKFIEKLKNDRIGIVVFAGKSYVQLPLTSDYGAAKMFLETITTDMIQIQGTAIGSAIEMAMNTLGYDNGDNKKWAKNNSRAIIIISDGENHEDDAIAMAKKAKKEGIIVSTIGLGSTKSVPIPIYKNEKLTGYKQDRNGNPVTTKINEEMLLDIANAGNGIYVRGNNTNVGITKIFDELNQLEKNTYSESSFSEYEDQYQSVLVVAFLFLIIELLIRERRNKYFSTLFFFGKKDKKNSISFK